MQERLERAAQLFAAAPVRLAVLFGSRARGEDRPSSDWDLGVLSSAVDLDRLAVELSRLLEGPVDLVDLARASPLLCDRAMREGMVVFDRTGSEFARFASLTARRYADTAKLRRAQEQSLQAFVNATVR